MKYKPAEYVILMFGGVRATARALSYDPSSISRWQKPRSKSTEGGIPRSAHSEILKQAKKFKLDITPEDLILGRRVSKQRGKA